MLILRLLFLFGVNKKKTYKTPHPFVSPMDLVSMSAGALW